jgi:hypothetical protein
MLKMLNLVAAALNRSRPVNRAQGYTEYVILVALIAIAAYAAVQLFGSNVSTAMSNVAGSV